MGGGQIDLGVPQKGIPLQEFRRERIKLDIAIIGTVEIERETGNWR